MKKIWEIALFIIKVTFFSFGGGQAAIPIIYRIAVKDKKWLKKLEFQKLVITTNLLPGPGLVQTLAFISIKKLGKLVGIIVSLLALFPHLLFATIIYIIFEKINKPNYIFVLGISVMPIICTMLIGTVIRFTKNSVKLIGLPWTIFLIIVSCYYYLLIPSPYNLSAIIMLFSTFIVILLTYIYQKIKKNKDFNND